MHQKRFGFYSYSWLEFGACGIWNGFSEMEVTVRGWAVYVVQERVCFGDVRSTWDRTYTGHIRKNQQKNSEKPLGTWNLSRIFLRLWKVSDLGFFVNLFLLPMSEQLSEPTETTKWENIVKYNAIYINTYDCNCLTAPEEWRRKNRRYHNNRRQSDPDEADGKKNQSKMQ